MPAGIFPELKSKWFAVLCIKSYPRQWVIGWVEYYFSLGESRFIADSDINDELIIEGEKAFFCSGLFYYYVDFYLKSPLCFKKKN
jgi:hypothetical protein